MSATNETTQLILNKLFSLKIPSWRHNVLPIPIYREGAVVGFRPGSKSGITDIVGYLPAGLFTIGRHSSLFAIPIYIEIKTGKDRLRPEQIGFIEQARRFGCITMVVKNFDDFLIQWNKLLTNGINYANLS